MPSTLFAHSSSAHVGMANSWRIPTAVALPKAAAALTIDLSLNFAQPNRTEGSAYERTVVCIFLRKPSIAFLWVHDKQIHLKSSKSSCHFPWNNRVKTQFQPVDFGYIQRSAHSFYAWSTSSQSTQKLCRQIGFWLYSCAEHAIKVGVLVPVDTSMPEPI